MGRWRTEDKELVIKMLSERADGVYVDFLCARNTHLKLSIGSGEYSVNWRFSGTVFHQVCGVPSMNYLNLWTRYERILKKIKRPNRDHARHLLQCPVAIRPLQVEELAEVLAVDFDDADGTPKLNPNWL